MSSERDRLQARERREWIEQEEKRQRESEDRAEYTKYVRQLRENHVEPLSFEEWRRHIPTELNDAAPEVRGGAATANSSLQRLAKVAVDRVRDGVLVDGELTLLGFDCSDRVLAPELLNTPGVAMAFDHFAKNESRYIPEIHYPVVSGWISRNGLFPSDRHIMLTFNHLFDLHLLPEPPEPEPTNPELNQYGVNLNIASDPEFEAALAKKKKRERYETEIVVTDRETGKGWTEYQLDHVADSETYRRLMRIPRVYKNPALEPKH